MMSAIRDVPERPVPATKIGEREGMASSQTLSPPPAQAIYPPTPAATVTVGGQRELGDILVRLVIDVDQPQPPRSLTHINANIAFPSAGVLVCVVRAAEAEVAVDLAQPARQTLACRVNSICLFDHVERRYIGLISAT